MNSLPYLKISLMTAACILLAARSPLHAGSVSLGAAESFSVLAATTVTNTGPTSLSGDLGVSPGTAISGFPPGTFSGTIHLNDALAIQAQADALNAYNILVLMPETQILTGQDLGGLTLTPGVYQFDSSAQLTGTLTLDGLGLDNPLFVFQIGSTLTTASLSIIDTINGATSDNVYFQVGSSATLGTGTDFEGNILAFVSDTLTTGATVEGRVIALTGAVTLDSNLIAVPEPGALLLVLCGLTTFFFRRGRAQS
ncbi:hypothetical protein GCM10023213_17830 [Prosthecobacter algae]|uniref:Secreted protein with PEP-CTERM sorting signal n=1 Tax=Prosthecobacter algae TaxID=1144682 RepID=A0ABP9P1A5_9BACT